MGSRLIRGANLLVIPIERAPDHTLELLACAVGRSGAEQSFARLDRKAGRLLGAPLYGAGRRCHHADANGQHQQAGGYTMPKKDLIGPIVWALVKVPATYHRLVLDIVDRLSGNDARASTSASPKLSARSPRPLWRSRNALASGPSRGLSPRGSSLLRGVRPSSSSRSPWRSLRLRPGRRANARSASSTGPAIPRSIGLCPKCNPRPPRPALRSMAPRRG